MNPLGKLIGNTLEDVRLETGIYKIDIAIACNMTPDLIESFFAGEKTPNHPELFKICDAMGVAPELLLHKAVLEQNISDPTKKKTIAQYISELGENLDQ